MNNILKFLIALLDRWNNRDSLRTLGAARSPQWDKVRDKHIQQFPLCLVCDKRGTKLEPNSVHHLRPFHLFPQDELNSQNLATACSRCHLLIFHLNNFKSYNLDALEDARKLREKILNRP